jgi:hypothetical protein
MRIIGMHVASPILEALPGSLEQDEEPLRCVHKIDHSLHTLVYVADTIELSAVLIKSRTTSLYNSPR